MAMVFTMVAAVIEKLNEYFDQNTKEREEAVERAKEESEAEERVSPGPAHLSYILGLPTSPIALPIFLIDLPTSPIALPTSLIKMPGPLISPHIPSVAVHNLL